jgi:hypothetical protein
VPPFVGVAVNVTLVPAQIGEGTLGAIDTLTDEMLFTVIVMALLVDVAVEGHTALLVITTLTAFPFVNAVVENVALFVPTAVAPIYHWYEGVVPPLVGVAVNVTLVLAQIGEGTSAFIETLTDEMLFTVIVMVLLVEVAVEGHTALLVITTLTTSPLANALVENVALFVPTVVAPIYHWYEGVVPPFVGVAVNVTLSPAQIVVDGEAAILTEGVRIGLTV